MLASFVIKRWFWWQLIMLKVWLQQKPILTTNSLALLNYFAARTSVTCDAKNMCDKADMNLGKGNIVIWYYCIVCGRERAMDSMGFTRNSYGWVPAATQLAVSLATVILYGEVSPWDIFDLLAMDSAEKYTAWSWKLCLVRASSGANLGLGRLGSCLGR